MIQTDAVPSAGRSDHADAPGRTATPETDAPAARSGPSYRQAVEAFGDVAAALSSGRGLEDLLHLVADRICDLVGVRRCSVYLRDEKTGLFRGQVGRAGSDIDPWVKRLVAGGEADGFTREIVASRRPVVIADALGDPRPVRSTMRAWGVRSMLGVPMVLQGEVLGIVFLDDEDRPCAFPAESRELGSIFADLAATAIAQERATTQVRGALENVARQNRLLKRATAADDRLAELALAGAGLEEIATAVAELTGKRVAVYDGRHRRRAVAPHVDEADAPGLLLEPGTEGRAAVRTALADLGPAPAVLGPFAQDGPRRRFLAAPVVVRGMAWGHVVLTEVESRLTALDRHVVRRAASHVAVELAAEQRAAAAEWDSRAALVGDLLRGDRDERSIARRAEFLHLDLDLPHVMALVTSEGVATGEGPAPRAVAEAVAGAGVDHDVLAAGVAEGVVLVIEQRADVAPLEALEATRRALEAALAGLGDPALRAAVSSPFAGAASCPAVYDEVRQVARCAAGFVGRRAPRVLTAGELGAGTVLLAATDEEGAHSYAQRSLGLLLEPAHRDLLLSLQAFLEHGRSVRQASVALGVHENTVRYRLARAEELSGLGVAQSSDDQMTAQLAVLVLRMRGDLPWRSAPAGA